MMQAQPSSIATRNGVIAGVLIGMLSLPVIALNAVGRAAGVGGGLLLLFLLAALVAFAVAGFSASRRNGLLRSGVWAGALAGLITAFIALCLGVVILTLLAPYAVLVATHVTVRVPAGRRLVAGIVRLAFVRLILGALLLAACGLIAGLVGGLLGRIGRPHDAGGQRAPYVASPPPPSQPQGYAPPMPNARAGVYTPAPQTPQFPPAPTAYYPTGVAYDDSAPTTIRDSQG